MRGEARRTGRGYTLNNINAIARYLDTSCSSGHSCKVGEVWSGAPLLHMWIANGGQLFSLRRHCELARVWVGEFAGDEEMKCRLKKDSEWIWGAAEHANESAGKVERNHGKRRCMACWKEYGLGIWYTRVLISLSSCSRSVTLSRLPDFSFF